MMPYVPALAGSKPTGFTPGFHPTIVPSSVEKRKRAGAEVAAPALVTPEIMKACLPEAVLNTVPVGVPLELSGSPGAGIETTNDCGVPAVLYSVETPLPFSEIQKRHVPEHDIPHRS